MCASQTELFVFLPNYIIATEHCFMIYNSFHLFLVSSTTKGKACFSRFCCFNRNCYRVICELGQAQPRYLPLTCLFLWLWTAHTAFLKPFTDSSLRWNLLPYSTCTTKPWKLTHGLFYGSQPVLIGWWIQKVKGGKVTPLAQAVTVLQLPLTAGRQTPLEQNVIAHPLLSLVALGFTVDRHDIWFEWNL